MKRILLLIIIIFSSSTSIANHYLPLQTGNKWFFIKNYWYPGHSGQRIDSLVIGRDTIVNGIKYYSIIGNPFEGSVYNSNYFIRYDTLTNTLREFRNYSPCNNEFILFNFNLNLNDSNSGYCYTNTHFVYIINTDSLIFSQNTNIKGFTSYYSQHVTFSQKNLFASNFGIIYYYSSTFGNAGGSGYSAVLKYCVIDGIVYGDTTLSIQQVTTETPASYSLSQNYPNPFNPSTKINLDLPAKNNVKLSVYNIIGQEVAVLVNEILKPGSYQFTFDATSLPSGVYFYRLTAGNDFSRTKKMVLIK